MAIQMHEDALSKLLHIEEPGKAGWSKHNAPDSVYAVSLSLFNTCLKQKDLVQGKLVHSVIVQNGLQLDSKMACQAIRMFASCGDLLQAHEVFNHLLGHNVFTWTAIITAYARYGEGDQALLLYAQMQTSGVNPNSHTFVALVNACSTMLDVDLGRGIHDEIIKHTVDSDVFVANALLDMYAKCGCLVDACNVFDRIQQRDVVSWNTKISGHVQHGHAHEALQFFNMMGKEGVYPDKVTYLSVFKACASIEALNEGMRYHADMTKNWLELDSIVGNTLIDMYAKCGSLKDAQWVFNQLSRTDLVSWNAMLSAYVDNGQSPQALTMFEKMQQEVIELDRVTFLSLVKACACTRVVHWGRTIHAAITNHGLLLDTMIANALINMYTKCGSMEDAQTVFNLLPKRDVISWSIIIEAHAEHGNSMEALQMFEKMQEEGIAPDKVTLMCMLKACCMETYLDCGKVFHASIIDYGLESDSLVGSSLIDMYSKCGSLSDAHNVLDTLPSKNVVSWSALITGYTNHGQGQKALQVFEKMQLVGTEPDAVSYVSALRACTSIASLEHGRSVHFDITESNLDGDLVIANTLVDMYAKCGILEDAHDIFENILRRDVVSWNVMIEGYARNGECSMSMQYFQRMQLEGIKPDTITFIIMLFACSQVALVSEAVSYFKQMSEVYGMHPTYQHYVCMVDLLGRAGYIDEAEDVIFGMPLLPDKVAWMALLSSCVKYNNLQLGEQAFKHLTRMDKKNASVYILISNLYAANCMWDDVQRTQAMKTHEGAWKTPGQSWIEVGKRVYTFVANDECHPFSDSIYMEWERLRGLLKEAGYVPHLATASHLRADSDEEEALCGHSEKLALAFGLINTPPGTPLRIFKNLRMCMDCHNATRMLSKIVGRKVIQRDSNRFHYFDCGNCSCGEYW